MDFVGKVDGKLVTSFAFSPGVRNDAGVWTTDQAQNLINYTHRWGNCRGGVRQRTKLPLKKVLLLVIVFQTTHAISRYFEDLSAMPGMRIAGPGTVEGVRSR